MNSLAQIRLYAYINPSRTMILILTRTGSNLFKWRSCAHYLNHVMYSGSHRDLRKDTVNFFDARTKLLNWKEFISPDNKSIWCLTGANFKQNPYNFIQDFAEPLPDDAIPPIICYQGVDGNITASPCPDSEVGYEKSTLYLFKRPIWLTNHASMLENVPNCYSRSWRRHTSSCNV